MTSLMLAALCEHLLENPDGDLDGISGWGSKTFVETDRVHLGRA